MRGGEMGFIDSIKERAKQNLKTIVLPESDDIRTIEQHIKRLKKELLISH